MISAALSLARAGPKALEGALIGLARGHAGKGKRTTLLFDISSSLNFTCLIFIYLKSILFTGVISSQYGIVGEVLLWTLAKVLGSEFDSAAKQS